jgi:heptosyltransferase-2
MRRPASTDAHVSPSVVVPQTSFLGDVVLTTPLLTALRRRLQPRRLAVVVRADARALVEGHPDVDTVLIDDKHGADRGIAGGLAVARRLRREGFDLAVVPHRSIRTALVVAAAGIARRVGFDASRGAWLFHERVRRDRTRHDVERNLALMEPFGGWDEPPCLHVPVQSEAAARARVLVPSGSGPLVVMAPGSVWATKRWAVEGFAALARRLARDGARVVLTGGPDDVAVAERVVALAECGVTSLAGRTDLATSVALIDRAAVLVANDSAPMHIGCARQVPVVGVFCATTPAQGYGPWGIRTRVVEMDLACRPCGRHGGRTCPRGTEDCMRLIEPERVLAAVHAVWRPDAAA